ncbi:hypothetical protein [Aurantibacter sp.]|uniref:hypothetical protein n=1 Tax=Aurantibacter sp. TaxID=2807103 RepID=UPI003267C53D
MRTFKKYNLSIVLLLIIWSCNKSDNSKPEELVNNPIAAILTFPEDNTECNEGVIINDTESRVNFQWNDTEFTDNYTVVLKNLDTDIIFETESTSNSVEIIIERSTSYQWYVISKSESSDVTAKSDLWQFYNAGNGSVYYVPFPADVLAPENGSTISALGNKIFLEWNTDDLDNDLKQYEVFLGTENTATESLGFVNENKFEVNVVSGTEYFWMIKSIDEAGNISNSEVFNFLVN